MKSSAKNVVSRIAPTPSGYLHTGNAYNFILAWWMTRWLKGELWLRIDDADQARTRPEFVEDIFETLEWLQMDWDHGPRDSKDFYERFSQTLKKESYFQTAMSVQGAFACQCSRKEIQEKSPSGIYPGTCAPKELAFIRGQCSLRVKVPENRVVKMADKTVELGKNMGDFVLWRKDDFPSYQLTSLVDDRDMGVNLIVRGEDLLESSAAQIYLAEKIGWKHVADSKIIHHSLIKDEQGEKYSKSQMADSPKVHLKSMRAQGATPKDLLNMLKVELGLAVTEENPQSLQDLLKIKPPHL